MDLPQSTMSADGDRLHLNYGPIDLLVSVDGPGPTRAAAFAAATERFDGLLDELVTELPLLRTPLDQTPDATKLIPVGPVARRMVNATWPLRLLEPVSPMAAVAGAVADEIGAAIADSDPSGQLDRWVVNNGGDIAMGLTPGHHYRLGLVVDPRHAPADGTGVDRATTIRAIDGVGGVATSGRHGRSFSLGIADSVTVLAVDSAAADAAATLIANRVDLPGHPSIERIPANDLEPDNDLGQRLVTVSVKSLSLREVATALDAGLRTAEGLMGRGLIVGAAAYLAGQSVSTTVAP